MKKKICFITTSRSDYDRQYWLLKDIQKDMGFDLQLIVMGSHLSKKFGFGVEQIIKDGFRIREKINILSNGDSKVDMGNAIAKGTARLTQTLMKLDPDIVFLFGDRYELLAAVNACLSLQIPIAHIAGGQVTQGAIDDQVRHMITKAAHVHFTANSVYAKRIKQMGEEPWRIFNTGSPSLDSTRRYKPVKKSELEQELGFDLSRKTALVTFHPVTLELGGLKNQLKNLLSALSKAHNSYGLQFVITYPNSDVGYSEIISQLKKFVTQHKTYVRLVKNLGQRKYLSLLNHVDLMIGNSSSGIVEAPSFNLPAVNIGDRQKGRLFAKNVFQAGYSTHSILKEIGRALKYRPKKTANPYGDAKSSPRILKLTRDILKRNREDLLMKRFIDIRKN